MAGKLMSLGTTGILAVNSRSTATVTAGCNLEWLTTSLDGPQGKWGLGKPES